MIIERKIIYYRQRKEREKIYNDTINCKIINDRGILIGQRDILNTEICQAITALHLNCNDSMYVTVHYIMSRESFPGINDMDIKFLKK